jgi:DNA-binding NtrC family response regulator
LLRFLEAGEIRRVGENEPFQVDVRVLCATNRELREMVAADEFREDLFFRINTFEIRLPPLRERREDIPQLAEHLLLRAMKGKVGGPKLAPSAVDAIAGYDWPGNVRELANVMEYAAILCGGETITAEHLPAHLRGGAVRATGPLTLHELEMQHIIHTLEKNDGNKPETARQLGISLKTLYNKLNAMNESSSLAG